MIPRPSNAVLAALGLASGTACGPCLTTIIEREKGSACDTSDTSDTSDTNAPCDTGASSETAGTSGVPAAPSAYERVVARVLASGVLPEDVASRLREC